MCLARIFGDRVEIINCGDSRAMVFKNGELAFFTVEHNWTNPAERKRVTEMGGRFVPDQSFELMHETCMKGAYAERAYFNPLVRLATTQALGHHRSTGYAPDTVVIPYSRGDRLRVVMGSDGLWDMVMEDLPADKHFLMTQSGEQIMDRFKSRWLQKWEMHTTNPVTGLQDIGFYAYTEKQCDDITVVAIDITPTRLP
jgi:serine/threonine protein phosphatase PrpC